MKLTMKFVPILILMSLISSLFFLKGCGKVLNGGQCGGCPDTTAPFGSTITAGELSDAAMSPTGSVCYPSVSFQVIGPDGLPMNDVCVELNTNGLMALHNPNSALSCASVAANPKSYIRTRSDSTGTITVDFLIDSPCDTLGLDTAATAASFFVQATSCSINGTSTAAVTISPACP